MFAHCLTIFTLLKASNLNTKQTNKSAKMTTVEFFFFFNLVD